MRDDRSRSEPFLSHTNSPVDSLASISAATDGPADCNGMDDTPADCKGMNEGPADCSDSLPVSDSLNLMAGICSPVAELLESLACSEG